jgi:O-acetylhomoserine (thiol)-lyase
MPARKASDRAFGFDTLQIHAGQRVDATTGARAQPIYQTAAYVFEDSQHAADLFDLNRFGNTYTRIVNPTNAAFEERMAMLEGGVGALATSSGMAATAITMLTLVSGGDGIVSSQNLYGGTHNQFALQLPRFGVDVRFVDPHDLDAVRAAIDERTRVLYAETIGNPRIDILDIAGWAQIAEDAGLPLVIDNTFATPYLCRPFEHGAHIVVHSATKFIGGHGTSIGGVIVDSGRYDWERGLFPGVTEPSPGYRGMRFSETFGNFAFITKARVETMRDFGPVLSPFNAFLLMQGLETLSLRMARHVENARALAALLRDHPRVRFVSYPDDPASPYAAAAQRYLPLGPGAILAFGIEGGREAGRRFIEACELCSHLANVGDAKTLVIHPASTTHRRLDEAALAAGGVTEDLIRVSVGLEDIDDIVWDIERALAASA